MKKNIIIMFGGVSAEHEVSIISGLQILQNINTDLYTPHTVYVKKNGEPVYLKGLTNPKDFLNSKKTNVSFTNIDGKPYLIENNIQRKRILIDCVYLAFHGGVGEGGGYQGLLESIGAPFTSPSAESSTITINKVLTKKILKGLDVNLLEDYDILKSEFDLRKEEILKDVGAKLKYPMIIKPAHLGSSIGITIVNNPLELQKELSTAFLMDDEILIERFVEDFYELNISVIKKDGDIVLSEIERPVKTKKILDFEDKYANGAKNKGAGMASLDRELPADIPQEMGIEIQRLARLIYTHCKCDGLVRIDFLVENGLIYLEEVNSIPGSLAFYIWEASGITFRDQITQAIVQGIKKSSDRQELFLDYETDIVEKFVNSL